MFKHCGDSFDNETFSSLLLHSVDVVLQDILSRLEMELILQSKKETHVYLAKSVPACHLMITCFLF